MKIKNLTKSLVALAALVAFAACSQNDNAVQPSAPLTLHLTKAQPTDNADGIWVKPISWLPTWNVSFTLTFANEVVINNATPEGISLVNVYDGAAVETKQFEETHWTIVPGEDAKSVEVKLVNEDGSLIGIKFGDEGYKLTVPAGVVSNVDGTRTNDEITETFYTSALAKEREGLPTALTVVSVLPEGYDAENNLWVSTNPYANTLNINFTVTFDEDVKIVSDKPEGITLLQRGTNESIITVKNLTDFGGVHWVAEAVEDNSKAVRVRLVDDDFGGTKGAKLEDEAYKLTIPAGIITNTAGNVPNAEITETFYSSEAAKQI